MRKKHSTTKIHKKVKQTNIEGKNNYYLRSINKYT